MRCDFQNEERTKSASSNQTSVKRMSVSNGSVCYNYVRGGGGTGVKCTM